ncbi:GlcG/HbpS family heme-binding protein [Nisaea sp.]|uniref:GlcG/HbpS family heme-binding protein n=1 Tax=Nisaea sp. TaxID=2024842 RepID=UPI003B52F14C
MSGYFLVDVASTLTLEQARAVCDGTLAAGREAGLLPLTVAVLDSGANLVHFQREDGCGTVRGDIAIGKAAAALGMGIPSRTIRDRLKDRPAFQSAIAAASDGRFIPVPGGVLILNAAGQAVGAVGVSGDASDRDEFAAIAGIKSAGLSPNPPEPADNWQDASL